MTHIVENAKKKSIKIISHVELWTSMKMNECSLIAAPQSYEVF